MNIRVFTGLQPTGRLHIGNYLGAIRPVLDLAEQPGNDVIMCIADLHALTVEHDPVTLRQRTLEMAATLVACGLDPRTRVFVQSSVPAHTELAYLLECTATFGEMRRMIQFKEKSHGQESVRLSLLTYPTLMAADILAYQTDVVPVGEDQRQHLELTTTLATRFNAKYGEVFTVPRGVLAVESARVKDLRTPMSKMGKSRSDSYGTLFLQDSPDEIAAKVKRAVTDAEPGLSFDPVARPGVANLAVLLAALTGTTPERALDGLVGAAALKAAVADALIAELGPIRQRYAELVSDHTHIDALLSAGRDAVAPIAVETVARTRDAMGLLGVG